MSLRRVAERRPTSVADSRPIGNLSDSSCVVSGMTEGATRVAVHRLRKRYRRLLKEEIALTLDDESEAAVEDEIRYLFGVFSR